MDTQPVSESFTRSAVRQRCLYNALILEKSLLSTDCPAGCLSQPGSELAFLARGLSCSHGSFSFVNSINQAQKSLTDQGLVPIQSRLDLMLSTRSSDNKTSKQDYLDSASLWVSTKDDAARFHGPFTLFGERGSRGESEHMDVKV